MNVSHNPPTYVFGRSIKYGGWIIGRFGKIFACVGGKVYAEDSYSDFRNDNNTHDNRLLSLYWSKIIEIETNEYFCDNWKLNSACIVPVGIATVYHLWTICSACIDCFSSWWNQKANPRELNHLMSQWRMIDFFGYNLHEVGKYYRMFANRCCKYP